MFSITGLGILALQVLIGTALMEATFFGSAYRSTEEGGLGSRWTILNLIASAAGAFFLGWWWCGAWFAIYLVRLAATRGRTAGYAPDPEGPDIDYGKFGSIAEKMGVRDSAPVPEDDVLREYLRNGKTEDARRHAKEMMEVARSVGNEKRAAEYAGWLGIAP